MQVLPTITTITPSLWRKKVEEVKNLKLEEIALFPTCLEQEERKELYALLEKTNVKKIPLVHIRNDMELWELEYFIKRYKTVVFNTHTRRKYPHIYDYGKYKKLIYIENTYEPFDEKEIKEFGGICLDLSHLENDRLLRSDVYKHNIHILKKHLPGCSHISAIKPETIVDEKHQTRYASHRFENLSEFDYLERYPMEYIAFPVAIELENTIEEQLKVKDYVSTFF